MFFDYISGSSKKSKHQTKTQQNAERNTESGLDLSDLDLSSIQLSEAEMRALSGLTPALSRRLQQQLLASLPPAAARSLRRTLSLNDPVTASAPPPRSRSASKAVASEPTTPATNALRPHLPDYQTTVSRNEAAEEKDKSSEAKAHISAPKTDDSFKEELELSAPQYCTLPRLKRHSTRSRESTPPMSPAGDLGEYIPKLNSKEPSHSRGSSHRSTPDRPLLSKYLTPERTLSLDESYSSDGGSILSEPSYIAAYGTPSIGNAGLGFRRHSMRLNGEQPRKRISRFLRADFFDSPSDESVYAKHKKEKELETQKILREIREKRNKSLEISDMKSPTETIDGQQTFKDDSVHPRKCLSPISPISSILSGKERSRSNTPFFPILDNIKESTLDSSLTTKSIRYGKFDDSKLFNLTEESVSNKESKISRPKSYPIKNIESFNKPNETDLVECNINDKDSEPIEKTLPRESKLLRPKSYPTSSPSPEKVLISRNVKSDTQAETRKAAQTEETPHPEIKNDVEVSFSIVLPKKSIKPNESPKPDLLKKSESQEQKDDTLIEDPKKSENTVTLKKYQVVNDIINTQISNQERENGTPIINNEIVNSVEKSSFNEDAKLKVMNHTAKKEEINLKPPDTDLSEKQGTIKKKIIKKVSSKTKTEAGNSQEGSGEGKPTTEKKKVTKKVKEKSSDEGTKTSTVTKKKSVLQSIGHKLEKLASTNKSSSPDKFTENSVTSREIKKDNAKLSRMQREQSVPVNADPPTESNFIKRAVTLTDVAALDTQNTTPSKTTVSKVLGLFKKFEPKEKNVKTVEKSQSDNLDVVAETNGKLESLSDGLSDYVDTEKPKRPTSLLLNGLGRKNKYGRTTSDSVSATFIDNDDQSISKKENNSKNLRNSLKLDFSRLPRVKKIVPTNPVIEPQMMNITSNEKGVENKDVLDKNSIMPDSKLDASLENVETQSRSRSRSRSTYSNSEVKSDNSAETKESEKNPLSPMESTVYHPQRNHESTTPEKEDIVDRIRRKSFYSRFNEKKQRRKSNLVGPGAAEYDPVARIHGQPSETKFDMSPTSPVTYDLSPGYSVGPDVSPSTERYRSLLTDLSNSARSNLRFDNYGLNDKIDTYRSLDRNDFRKYPGTRSYLDYDQPSSYTSHRYTRTKSLLDSSDGNEDLTLGSLRDPHKYNRTISMYSPGSYATYRPMRTRNSAIILKESEKEPSPENILEKIRNRKKISISVTRKPDSEKDSLLRCVYLCTHMLT